ncbi:hypothetical protein quinque_010089 [Culex quinquefasciatus]
MTQVNPPSLAFLLLTTLFICALTLGARPVESAAAVVTHQDHAAALTALLHRTVRSSDDDNSSSSNSVNEGGPCGANCIHRRLYSMCICVTCPENSTICVMKSNTITINMTRPWRRFRRAAVDVGFRVPKYLLVVVAQEPLKRSSVLERAVRRID